MAWAKPDPKLTPGRYTDKVVVRHVTLLTKIKVYRRYGIKPLRYANYTIDHLVPLEIGGTNDIENLWPQPKLEAVQKDLMEDTLGRLVRNGKWSMAKAQQYILSCWGGQP